MDETGFCSSTWDIPDGATAGTCVPTFTEAPGGMGIDQQRLSKTPFPNWGRLGLPCAQHPSTPWLWAGTHSQTHRSHRHSRGDRHRPALWKCSSGGRGRAGAGRGKAVPAHTLPPAPGGTQESSGTAAQQGWAGRAGHSPHCSLHSHWCLPKQHWLARPPQGTAEPHRCPGVGQSQTHLPVRTGCKSSWLPTPAPSGTTSSQPAPAGCARSCWSLETHGVKHCFTSSHKGA